MGITFQLFSVGVGIVAATIGFSLKFYLVTRAIVDRDFRRADMTYTSLFAKKIVSDHVGVHALLKIVRKSLAKYDTPEMADYGMLRRWSEAVELVFRPGEVRQDRNFVGIHPISGYNEQGEECLVMDKNTFHQQFLSIVVAAQQKAAFEVLLIAFLLQLVSLFVPV